MYFSSHKCQNSRRKQRSMSANKVKYKSSQVQCELPNLLIKCYMWNTLTIILLLSWSCWSQRTMDKSKVKDWNRSHNHILLFLLFVSIFDVIELIIIFLWQINEIQNSNSKKKNSSRRLVFKAVIQFCIPSAFGIILSEYRSVKNRLSMRVDFPRPDSPTNTINLY